MEGGDRAGTQLGSCRTQACAKGQGRCRCGVLGGRGAALGGAGGVGRCAPRVPQRTDTRVHTQRGGIPTPRACPLLHLEPHQECGDLTRAGGARCQPRGRRHPVLPAAASGEPGLLPKGQGSCGVSGHPTHHGLWHSVGCRRAQTRVPVQASQHRPCPLPGPAPTKTSRPGGGKQAPRAGGATGNPSPAGLRTGGGASSRPRHCTRLCTLSVAPRSTLHLCTHTHVLAACTDTSTHSWTCARVHARSPRPPLHAQPAAAPPGLAGHWLTPLTHIPSRAHAPPRFPAGPRSPPGHSSCLW